MSRLNLFFLFNIVTGYISFGLAFYAGCALAAALWAKHQDQLLSKPSFKGLLRACLCMFVLLVLQTSVQLWDSFQPRHSSSEVIRIALPILYLWLGNSVLRAMHQNIGEGLTHTTMGANKAEVKSAQSC